VLETPEQGVQVHEAGAHVALEARADGFGLGLLPVLVQDLADVDEVAQAVAAAKSEDEVLGPAQGALQIRASLVRHLSDLGGALDELAVDGIALDYAGVVLDADGGGELGNEATEVSRAPDLLQTIASGQLVAHRHLVYGLVAVKEGQAGLVSPAVLLPEEVLGLDYGGDVVDGVAVHQEAGNDSFLGLHVVGR
jgi:hypothetical protein